MMMMKTITLSQPAGTKYNCCIDAGGRSMSGVWPEHDFPRVTGLGFLRAPRPLACETPKAMPDANRYLATSEAQRWRFCNGIGASAALTGLQRSVSRDAGIPRLLRRCATACLEIPISRANWESGTSPSFATNFGDQAPCLPRLPAAKVMPCRCR